MSDSSGALPPAGWYPDPYGAPQERWWDGQQWTEHMNTPTPPAPVAEPEPYVAPATAQPAANPAPADPFAGFAQPATPAAGYQAPNYQQPAYEQPYEQPAYEAPSYQPPAYESPAYQAPATPVYEAPASPVYETPAYETPAYQAPTTPEPRQTYEAAPAEVAPAEVAPAAGQPNPASSFDFGFGNIIAGQEPSNSSTPTTESDSGLFGSWTPNEYAEPARNGPATAGLTFGILSFFLPGLAGLLGIILSAVGLGRAASLEREGEGPVGRGKSVAGIVISLVGTAASVALVIYALPLITAQLAAPGSQSSNGSTAADGAQLTPNGGTALETGTAGVINFPTTTDPAIQFTVTDIEAGFTCTADPAVVLSAENGQFVAVTLDYTLADGYVAIMANGAPLHLNSSDWIGFLADGSQVVNTDTGTSCIAEEEQFPSELLPGTTVSKTVVLDMAPDVTSISWSPTQVLDVDPGLTRWEWTVPTAP